LLGIGGATTIDSNSGNYPSSRSDEKLPVMDFGGPRVKGEESNYKEA